jgi:hypothetical protein
LEEDFDLSSDRILNEWTTKVDYSRFSCRGLHGKHVVATWKRKTGTIPAFALGPKKTKKNLCQIAGRRTFRLLTSSQPSGVK